MGALGENPNVSFRPLSALRRYALWLGFGAALIALAALVSMQYRWLRQLEGTSERAHRATLLNYVQTVSNEVRVFYRADGERVLNVPFGAFSRDELDRVARHFSARCAMGARSLFAVTFVPGARQRFLVFDPKLRAAVKPTLDESRAIEVATAKWRLLAERGVVVNQTELESDEREPTSRMILNPITDESFHVVGVAGMVLDTKYLRERVIPMAVQRASHAASVPGEHRDPITALIGANGLVLWRPEERDTSANPNAPWEVQQRFSFVFTDFKFAARGHGAPSQWAEANFNLNLALAITLAVSLLAGLLIAFRAASREMALSRLKSDFVSTVSHELRTPLASIRLFAELLRTGRVESGPKVREYGEHIDNESKRLSQLIANLLDFASMEAGHKTYRKAILDIAPVVSEVLKSFAARFEDLGFEVAYQGPSEPIPPLEVDQGAFVSAFSNLLDNAIKYSRDSREIAVQLSVVDHEAVLSVRDRGIGIPRQEQRKIFDRFHRVGTSLVQDVRGSGLGLAIVQHIVHGHGGRITVESKQGQGSLFAIYLPLSAATALASDHSILTAQRADSYGTS
jgi:signal transduction histidine kinase